MESGNQRFGFPGARSGDNGYSSAGLCCRFLLAFIQSQGMSRLKGIIRRMQIFRRLGRFLTGTVVRLFAAVFAGIAVLAVVAVLTGDVVRPSAFVPPGITALSGVSISLASGNFFFGAFA